MRLLTGLIIILVLILLGVGVIWLAVVERKAPEGWIPHDQVRGSEIIAHDLPYTLNFVQQESLIHLLNSGHKTSATSPDPLGPITKIILYLFNDRPNIELIPLRSDFSLFSVSQSGKKRYLAIEAPDKLAELLNGAYDS